jgi:uncharacterized protein (DUF1800 family)
MAVKPEKLNDSQWAWAPYKPDNERPWNLTLAGHLYRRAAFGADWDQLQRALSEGPQQTIDKLLRPQSDVESFNATHDEYETSANSVNDLRAWWLRRMIQTPHPLLEKMALFWHSHFATSGVKVKDARLMRQHVRLLRSQALGSFKTLLEGISRDPAVLIWLDADANRKALPNENFVRSLMETFTIGPDHCTEKAIKEASRAFTGWFVLRGKLHYIPREHDNRIKHFLGQEGKFTSDDVVRMLLEQPATAQRVVRKLYRWLISETNEPGDNLIAPLTESFAKDYDVLKLTETMLRSNLFFSSAAYRQRIKCPVEFAVGIVRGLEGIVSTTKLAQDLANLGQNLYHPPTVKGWTGGRYWMSSASVADRYNLASALLRDSGPYENKLNPRAIAEKHEHSTTESASRFLLELFLQDDLDPGVCETLLKTIKVKADAESLEENLRRFSYEVVTLPEFNLA